LIDDVGFIIPAIIILRGVSIFCRCGHGNNKGMEMRKRYSQRTWEMESMGVMECLGEFVNDAYDFKSEAQLNDLWLDISLSTHEQEIGFVHIIQAILGQRYKPLGNAPINEHC
jgi:hypothetical protein